MNKEPMNELEFVQLEKRLRPRLMQMGREFFGSDTEAEEVVQETWLRAWNVCDKVALTDAYILRIARNCCVSMWRRQRMQVELPDEDCAAFTEITPQEEVEEQNNSEWLRTRLRRLPQAEREVWQMFYDEGMDVEEIAAARGVTVGTVRKTISNVRNTLRVELRRHFLDLRHLILLAVVVLATGIVVAATILPGGTVRSVIEKVFHVPEDTIIYTHHLVERLPSYPGDMAECYAFVASRIHYPEESMKQGIGGCVLIRFVVEKDGRLTNFEVVESPDSRLSDEALRVLKEMPAWIPAKNNGREVRCRYRMPFIFRLK